METKAYSRETTELHINWRFANRRLQSTWSADTAQTPASIETIRGQVMRDLRIVA